MASETWYAARLLFASQGSSGSERDRLCEESIVLVRAADESHAFRAAESCGCTARDVAYHNEHGELIEWQFLGVLDVQDLCETEIENGMEVYSRLFFESQPSDDALKKLLEEHRRSETVQPHA